MLQHTFVHTFCTRVEIGSILLMLSNYDFSCHPEVSFNETSRNLGDPLTLVIEEGAKKIKIRNFTFNWVLCKFTSFSKYVVGRVFQILFFLFIKEGGGGNFFFRSLSLPDKSLLL